MTRREQVAGRIGLDEIEVIIPNLKRRYSGGTAVNRTIAPLIARRCRAVWLGPERPDGIAGLSLGDLLRMRFDLPAAARFASGMRAATPRCCSGSV